MTISSTITRDEFVGDGVTTDFPTTFPFFLSAELVVLENDTVADTTTLLTEGVEYTVTGGAGLTGTVIAASPPDSDKVWIVERETQRTQGSDYENQASVNLTILEQDLDRNAMRDQEGDRDLGRALRAPREDDPDSISMELPKVSARASKLAGFDASGAATAVDPATLSPPSITVGAFGQTLLPLATKANWQSSLEIFPLTGVLTKLGGDVLANRPAAAAFGVGIYFATDTGQHFYSNATVWTELGQLARYALASLPAAGDVGRTYIDTTRFHAFVDDGSAVSRIRAPLHRGAISGLVVLRFSGTSVKVSAGQCRVGVAADPDQDDAYLAATFQKFLSASWTAGDGASGLASAVTRTADTWYHLFLLLNPDDGSVDFGFDTSLTAANLLSDTLGDGFTKFRRFWSVKTQIGSTNMRGFVQLGDHCIWTDSALSFDAGSLQDYRGSDTKLVLNDVPPGVPSEVELACNMSGHDIGVSRLDHGSATIGVDPSLTAAPLATFQGGANPQSVHPIRLMTDTNQQITIRAATDAGIRPYLEVLSYRDFRGQYD